ncbi:MAG: hypothetical protein K2O89_06155 [Clostridia bacterium]|nr:hypothetical protein [Clostridia bacterium]
MEQDKKCEDCEFYKTYYTICDGKLYRIGGYCNNKAVHSKCSKIMYCPKPCDKWQLTRKRIEKYRDDISYVLKDIRKSLNEIKLIMKED